MNNIIIRRETSNDFKLVEHLTMRAFWNIHGPGCSEHLLIRKIRESDDYLPEISRIAEKNGKIVGAIYYTKAKVIDEETTHNVITFGPLAVEPTLQNLGIGRVLLEETIKLSKESGYSGIIIIGEPKYYPKRGFMTCNKFGITDSDGNNYDELMCYPLNKELFSFVHGKFVESRVFKECDNNEEIKKINSEFPNYRKLKIKEGFLSILDKRLGVVEAIDEDVYTVKFWEILIPAKLSKDFTYNSNRPNIGDDVLFIWNQKGISEIITICKNIL